MECGGGRGRRRPGLKGNPQKAASKGKLLIAKHAEAGGRVRRADKGEPKAWAGGALQ